MILFADESLASAVTAFRKLDVESLLLPVMVQLIVIILVARAFGGLFRRFHQPAVVGEMVAGIVMGPSLFGALFPEMFQLVFKPHLEHVPDALTNAAFPKIFTALAQIGLILLLFLIGLEFEFHHLKAKGTAAVLICVVGIAVPFLLGVGLARVIHPELEPHPEKGVVPIFGLTLFLGMALSITALPVLGRMLLEMGVTRTRIAVVAIAAAAIGDAVGWVLLAAVSALAQSSFDPAATLTMIGLTVAFFAAMLFVVRPLAGRYFRWSLAANHGQFSLNAMAVLLVLMLLSATATNVIGIFAIFGAFALGAVLSDQTEFREAVTARLRDFVTAFFLPIFFTYTGLRTEISSLTTPTHWLICGGVILTAILGKLGACGLTARLTGFSAKESVILGAMMNTRGLMELIVINVGYDLGVIPKSLFCILVLMAVVTTVMTTPILLRLRHGTEIDGPMKQSGFLD
ncbi:cation:proton antiporter [Limnoglobus roseus]|uniref:Sodium:proton antiporter n=1 Tax=Limnoglobus roseus TaxID=2598579 RepID=A0A5C1A8K9_9BACT|nr:cation:proton antiporter [Limnoglobus roseus]QEL14607.1 sodium:proton antiporter [Limnoglobus roseus]